ncbi:MAG TPA: energy transducer TonB [Pyrinomonadaceae bacterium]|jgi:TonB family protein|nr:energy transducer TonB [Pyrinomonadaceae bacterium]
MKQRHLTLSHAIITLLFCVPVCAQSTSIQTKHFAQDNLSFDYPAGWSVTDHSTAGAQQLLITREGSSVQITIVVQRDTILRAQLAAARQSISDPLAQDLAQKLSTKGERTDVRIDVGETQAEGVRLRGSLKKRPGTAEVYWLRRGFRFVNLIYLRADTDEAQGTEIWKDVRSSLKVDYPFVLGFLGEPKAESAPNAQAGQPGAVLAGKAIEIPKPEYPRLAKAAHASGTVMVQVVIDEQGKVVAAHAVSGHPLLYGVSVDAARRARFTPTLFDGEAVKITGVIEYHFVAQ